MHPASVRQTVIRARGEGLSARVITRITGVPARSQRRFGQKEIPVDQCAQRPVSGTRAGRPSVLAPAVREVIDGLVREEPGMKVSELLRRLRSDHGYQEGKNPVYAYVRGARPAPAPPLPVVRFEGVAGEFAQHDFGSLRVTYTDGRHEKLCFDAGRMKYSRALHVQLAAGETAECFLRGLEAFGKAMGGLPQRNVVDNMKAAVLRREPDPATGQERIRLNPHFAEFLQEIGVFAEPAHPYSGNQKGSVENLVKFAKGAFFTARRFRHREDLERQLGEWLQHVNAERPCDATGEIPRVRLAQERPWLRPLPFGAGATGWPTLWWWGRTPGSAAEAGPIRRRPRGWARRCCCGSTRSTWCCTTRARAAPTRAFRPTDATRCSRNTGRRSSSSRAARSWPSARS